MHYLDLALLQFVQTSRKSQTLHVYPMINLQNIPLDFYGWKFYFERICLDLLKKRAKGFLSIWKHGWDYYVC
jgi:hypothetical protein